MLAKLAFKNLTNRRFRTFLGVLSIGIGTAALFIALSLNQGIEQAGKNQLSSHHALNQITIRPDLKGQGVISFIAQNKDNKITPEAVEKFENLSNVNKVYKEIQFNGFASIRGSVLGLTLNTDSMLFGLPGEFLANDLTTGIDKISWNKADSEPYPALIPRKFLDLYNFTIASPQNLPKFSEDMLIGKKLTLYPNYSNFFGNSSAPAKTVQLEVVGFSDKINLIGLTLPYQIIEKLNEDFASSDNTAYTEVYAEVENETEITKTAAEIEKLGYSTNYFQKEFESLEAKLLYLQISLSIIIIIILITATISILSTFLAAISEQKKEIGLLRALGATKQQIRKLILLQSFIVGLLGSVTGIAIGLVGSIILNQTTKTQLEGLTFAGSKLFQFTPQIITSTLLFGLILALLAGYVPSKIAANTDPVEALRG